MYETLWLNHVAGRLVFGCMPGGAGGCPRTGKSGCRCCRPTQVNLTCASHMLNELDVSHNSALKILSCPENYLRALNVENNLDLIQLHCYNNSLQSLDVNKNVWIDDIDFYNNPLIKPTILL